MVPNWYSKVPTCKTDLIRKMFNIGEERITEIPSSSQLKPEFKILHSLCLFNLLPHIGNKNKVSDNDLLIMHCLSSPPSDENCLDLAYLIIKHMIIASNSKYKNCTVPYGMLLTRVFDYFKIDLSNEHYESAVKVYNLKNVKHMKNVAENDNPASPIMSEDAPGSKRQRTEENPPVFQNDFFQAAPSSPPPVNNDFHLNKNLNFNSFFPDFENPITTPQTYLKV